MGQKYWCKTADGVEGPYEPQALKFIDGFSPDILVSPDIPEASETWSRFSEVAELQAVINRNPKAGPSPVVIEAPPPTMSEVEAPATVIAEITSPVIETESPAVEAVPQAEGSKDEFAASTEMLDLMQKISQEMEQKKVGADAPAQVREPDLPKIKPVRKQLMDTRKPVLVAAVILVMAGLALLAVKTNAPKQWFNLIASKFHKEKKMPAPVAEKKLEPVKPASAPIAVKIQPKASEKKAPQTAQKPAAPEKEKTLATQKFYLPGVPSPKLTSSKIDSSSPLPEAKEETPPPFDDEEDKVNYGKNAKGDMDSGNEDWKKQASWGD